MFDYFRTMTSVSLCWHKLCWILLLFCIQLLSIFPLQQWHILLCIQMEISSFHLTSL